MRHVFLLASACLVTAFAGGLNACSDTPATTAGDGGIEDGAPGKVVLSLTQGGSAILSGDTYHMPQGASDLTVELFDVQVDRLILKNASPVAVTIETITLVGQGDALAEEWALLAGESSTQALSIANHKMEPNDTLSFQLRFSPVVGKSRSASLLIAYGDGEEYHVDVKGRGAPTSDFFSKGTLQLQKLFGDHREREGAVAMTSDEQGAVYFVGDLEMSNAAIAVARVNADGGLGWAKVFNGPFADRITSPSGPTARAAATNAISWGADGYLYVVGNYSWSFSNNTFYSWIAKIHPNTGDLVWSKLWSRVETIADGEGSSYVTGVDAHADDRIFVIGSTNKSLQTLLLSLKKSDGSILFARQIDFDENYTDRGLSLAFDGKEFLWLGGQYSGNSGYVVRLKDVLGTSPTVDWARRIEYGTGSMVNALEIDGQGNVFFSGIVPASEELTFNWGSLDDKGALRWMKAIPSSNDYDTAVGALHYEDGRLFVGGIVGDVGWDINFGDALLVSVDSTTGERNWSALYHNGAAETNRTAHRINGFAVKGRRITMVLTARTGDLSEGRYWGYWYDGLIEAVDYSPLPKISEITPVISAVGQGDSSDGYLKAISDSTALSAKYTDAEALVWADASEKEAGTQPSAEMLIMALELNEGQQ